MRTNSGIQPPDVTLIVSRSDRYSEQKLFAIPAKGPEADRAIYLGGLPAAGDLAVLATSVRVNMQRSPREDIPLETVIRDQGQSLWDLMEPSFRDFYSDYLFSYGISSIAICGPNAYLPWELIWPQGLSLPARVRAHMFGASFSITRWPTLTLPGSISSASLDIIAPREAHDPDEPGATIHLPGGFLEEIDLLKTLVPDRWTEGASAMDVWHLFAHPKPRVLHFSAHGSPNRILLQDVPITRLMLEAEEFGRLSQPTLVFLNSCRTGVSEWTPDAFDAESWAEVFIELGCTACVAPLWNVLGRIGKQVSVDFYRDLKQDRTLGQAMQARRRRGATVGGDEGFFPTWFAYTVFGNPNARVSFARPPSSGWIRLPPW